MENIPNRVKQVIIDELKNQSIEVVGIYLFGSRAKGNYNRDSDWDFFVVVNKDLDFTVKRKLIQLIKRKLSEIDYPLDIIIQSQNVFENRKSDKGYLTYYIVKEGIKI